VIWVKHQPAPKKDPREDRLAHLNEPKGYKSTNIAMLAQKKNKPLAFEKCQGLF